MASLLAIYAKKAWTKKNIGANIISRQEASWGEQLSPLPRTDKYNGDKVVSMKICKVENCNSKHYALGYCNKHWRRFKNHGDPLFLVNPVVYDSDICKIEGCNKKRTSKGYCQTHYNRVLKYGDPTHCEATYHGMWGTPIYETWHNMIQRCYYEKCRMYYRYGGRGITVCEAWRKSFIAFYEDMGDRPFPKAQIDRIDNDGNYEPTNCRWVTCLENNRNRPQCKK